MLETRFVEMTEVRADGDGKALAGYAAVFNSLSADLGGFKERILPGAFAGALKSGQDIRALVDHDSTKLLGRTSNQTLRIAEDANGLRIEVDLPNTSYANDVRELVKRGDVRGMSFGFRVPKGGERFTKEAGQSIRELSAIDVREVTVTSIPAYGETSASVRVDPGAAQRAKQPEEITQSNLAMRRLLLRITD